MRRPSPFSANPAIPSDPEDPAELPSDDSGWSTQMAPAAEKGWPIGEILERTRKGRREHEAMKQQESPFDRPDQRAVVDPRGVDAGRMPAHNPERPEWQWWLDYHINNHDPGPLNPRGLPVDRQGNQLQADQPEDLFLDRPGFRRYLQDLLGRRQQF